MKTKRIRALLVAGLLSLTPAVTLTSCGGGGGGGGGASELDVSSNLSGHVMRFNLDEVYQTINFRGSGQVTSEYVNSENPSRNASFDGSYQIIGVNTDGGVSRTTVRVNLTDKKTGDMEQWNILYKIGADGRFIPEDVRCSGYGDRNIAFLCTLD